MSNHESDTTPSAGNREPYAGKNPNSHYGVRGPIYGGISQEIVSVEPLQEHEDPAQEGPTRMDLFSTPELSEKDKAMQIAREIAERNKDNPPLFQNAVPRHIADERANDAHWRDQDRKHQ